MLRNYYQRLIDNKKYLGYCPQKGDIYSVQETTSLYRVIAIQNNITTILISYTTKGE